MTSLFISVLLAAMCLECRAQKDNVLQPRGDVTATEGEAVTLGCQYNSSATNLNLFWYKQDGNNSPKFILSRFKLDEGKTPHEFTKRFSSTLDSNLRSVPLKIQKLQLSDSAVYYCALQPNYQGGRIYFGSGTKLTVETGMKYEPIYYKLTDNSTSWCLAAGFSQYNMTNMNKSSLFDGTQPTRIDNDPLYNQVAKILPGMEDKCESGDSGTVPCEDTLEPDEKVNFMSLTILGLRLLFLKTIIFNVLMTLRLWISQ